MRTGRRALVIATVVVLAVGVFASTPLSASAATTECGKNTVCYYYNAMTQVGSGTGASVGFTIARPKVSGQFAHSLTELAVESSDQNQAIEIGWIVSPALYHDSLSHIFFDLWSDNVADCDACGVTFTSKSVKPAMVLTPGKMASFSIQFAHNRWNLAFNGTTFGYFPELFWSGKFTRVGKVQAFGEVESVSTTNPTSQMGNGIFGTKPGSAQIKGFKILGGKQIQPVKYDQSEAPKVYKIGLQSVNCLTNCSMNFGGPGY